MERRTNGPRNLAVKHREGEHRISAGRRSAATIGGHATTDTALRAVSSDQEMLGVDWTEDAATIRRSFHAQGVTALKSVFGETALRTKSQTRCVPDPIGQARVVGDLARPKFRRRMS